MNKVFARNLDKFIAIYLDDILIFNCNWMSIGSTFGGHWTDSGKRNCMGDFTNVNF